MWALTPGEDAALLVAPVLESLFVVGALSGLLASIVAGTDRVTETSQLRALLEAPVAPYFLVRLTLDSFSANVSKVADRLVATSENAALFVTLWPALASDAAELLLIGFATHAHLACVRSRPDGMGSSSESRALLVAPAIEYLLVAGTCHLHSTSASIYAVRLCTSSGCVATRIALCPSAPGELLFARAAAVCSNCSPASIRLGSDFCLDRELCGLEREFPG